MFGEARIFRSQKPRFAGRALGAAVAVVLAVFLTIPATSADACPGSKSPDPAVSVVHRAEFKASTVAQSSVSKNDVIRTAMNCCGGSHHGGGCSAGHCSSCLTALSVPPSGLMLKSGAMRLVLAADKVPIVHDSTPDFRPPRLVA